MSWFRRRPRLKEPEKLKPHKHSPISEQILKQTKEKTKPTQDKDNKNGRS